MPVPEESLQCRRRNAPARPAGSRRLVGLRWPVSLVAIVAQLGMLRTDVGLLGAVGPSPLVGSALFTQYARTVDESRIPHAAPSGRGWALACSPSCRLVVSPGLVWGKLGKLVEGPPPSWCPHHPWLPRILAMPLLGDEKCLPVCGALVVPSTPYFVLFSIGPSHGKMTVCSGEPTGSLLACRWRL